MEHITLFFCDTTNAYEGFKKNNENDYINFLNQLEKIRTMNNSQKIVLDFIGNDVKEELKLKKKQLLSFKNNDNIEIKSSNIDVYIIDQIKLEILLLKEKYVIDKIYYAEGNESLAEVVDLVIKQYGYFDSIEIIMPSKNGLATLNQTINSNYFGKQKINHID